MKYFISLYFTPHKAPSSVGVTPSMSHVNITRARSQGRSSPIWFSQILHATTKPFFTPLVVDPRYSCQMSWRLPQRSLILGCGGGCGCSSWFSTFGNDHHYGLRRFFPFSLRSFGHTLHR